MFFGKFLIDYIQTKYAINQTQVKRVEQKCHNIQLMTTLSVMGETVRKHIQTTHNQISVFLKGLKFAIISNKIRADEIITIMETAIYQLY